MLRGPGRPRADHRHERAVIPGVVVAELTVPAVAPAERAAGGGGACVAAAGGDHRRRLRGAGDPLWLRERHAGTVAELVITVVAPAVGAVHGCRTGEAGAGRD